MQPPDWWKHLPQGMPDEYYGSDQPPDDDDGDEPPPCEDIPPAKKRKKKDVTEKKSLVTAYNPDDLFAIVDKKFNIIETKKYKDIQYGTMLHILPKPRGKIVGLIMGSEHVTGCALGDIMNIDTF